MIVETLRYHEGNVTSFDPFVTYLFVIKIINDLRLRFHLFYEAVKYNNKINLQTEHIDPPFLPHHFSESGFGWLRVNRLIGLGI